MSVTGTLIRLLHCCFVAWMVCIPFIGSLDQVLLHFVMCVFLLGHWACNNATCALTILEKWARGMQEDESSFVHRLVAPVYVISVPRLKAIVRWFTVLLMCVSAYRLQLVRWQPFWDLYDGLRDWRTK